MKHVAIYCRISKDDERRGEGVADQEEWGRGYAARTWPDLPVVVYSDNDITAAEREIHRPRFDQMCADISAGRVVHIVATNRKRITRDTAHWLDLVDDLLIPAGIGELHTKHRGVMTLDDLATDIDAVLGRREIRELTTLVRDKHDRLAAQGRPSGGRQLGLRPGRNKAKEATLEIVPAEADAIRWAAEAVLRHGWSLTAVGEEWERRGVQHPRRGRRGHKAWRTPQVRAVLTKPSLAGLRIVDGREIKATWPAILDVDTWRRLRRMLDTRREANRQTGRRKSRRYLLTGGIACCGLCDGRMRAGWRRDKGPAGLAYYECAVCHRVAVRADQLESHVHGELLAALDVPEFYAALADNEHEAERERITDALAGIDSQRAELGRLWARRKHDAVGWAAASDDLDQQEAGLRAELAALPPPAADADPQAVRADWDEMTLDERRHVIGIWIERVIVDRARPGVRRFEPSRVRIVWR